MNVALEYCYRDGSNYKRWSRAVLRNPDGLSVEEIRRRLFEATGRWRLFADVVHFQPEAVGLPTCYFTDAGYPPNEDDFELHELDDVVETTDAVTDRRSIRVFLRQLALLGHRREYGGGALFGGDHVRETRGESTRHVRP